MKNNKRLSFDVDASQIKLKRLLKKEFLELSMKAISSANPNRNGTHFTKEAMINAIETFKNKPILGYFENGDFVSHNGKWSEDEETKMSYWDTLGQRGERILGLIRPEDEVKVVEEDGLSWITLTCALWVQYNFKQVKRLIKDAQRAQKYGGATKNISVEVDITDWTDREDGVTDINKFNLVGITILGSEYGEKVEPGIAGAELKLADFGDNTEVFNKQKTALRMAYAKLDNAMGKDKEDYQMNNENLDNVISADSEATIATTTENITTDSAVISQTADATTTVENTEMLAKEEDKKEDDKKDEKKENEACGDNKENEACGKSNNDCDPEDKDEDEDDDEDDKEKDCKNAAEDTDKKEDTCPDCGKNPCECEAKKYEELKTSYDTLSTEHEALKADHEALKAKYEELNKQYEESKSHVDEITEKLSKYETAEFLAAAKAVIDEAHFDKEVADKFYEDCKAGKYADIDSLTKEVALAAFNKNKVEKTNFNMPVNSPKTIVTVGAETKVKKSKWDKLDEYVGK